ncbi:SMI1/KNR4 family protein [Planococcus sp. YIM B11945]|uniref:SMI1/KNR4 family protein n=1 Tax=Planococcus sp. YIM B11945 TaxID=3435410 RepID=UPI003D7C7660
MKKIILYGSVLFTVWKAVSYAKKQLRNQEDERFKELKEFNEEDSLTVHSGSVGLSFQISETEDNRLEVVVGYIGDDHIPYLDTGYDDIYPYTAEPYEKEVKSISRILASLMQKLDDKNEHLLLSHYGRLIPATSSFNQATDETEKKVLQLEKRIGYRLPKDHRLFLLEFNGARIYDRLLHGQNIGGGFHLFSVKEIFENYNMLETGYPEFLPIGDVEQQILAISLEALKNKNPNYIFRIDNMEGPVPLKMNLLMFLDYFVVSQGSVFWEWPIFDAVNFLRFEDEEDF